MSKNIEAIVSAYITIRDKIAEMKAKHKEELKPYNEALSKLEHGMLEELAAAGVESMRTPSGTAYRIERTSVTVADKSAFMDYVETTHAFDLLDVRANKTAVEGFLAEHEDVPPGVNIRREAAVGFRRS